MKKEYKVIAIITLVKIVINLVLNINTNFDGDEIMHIDSGNHLAWGYMSIQPFIGLIAWIQNLFHSDSVFVHHIFTHLFSVLIMFFCGLLTIKMGGGWKAVLLSMSCILVAPGINITNHSFMPLVFEQFFWIVSFYFFVSYCKNNKPVNLIYLAIFLGLGFMSKISILILIAGIGISILIYKRELFLNWKAWMAFAVFILIVSPNIYWQYQNDFPSYQHMTALYNKVLVKIALVDNIKLLFITTNPLTALIWGAGLIVLPFIKYTNKIKMALIALLCSFIILLSFRGQFHYFYPTILLSFCTGSLFWEKYIEPKRAMFWVYYGAIVTSSFYFLPRFMPILPLNKYIKLLDLDSKQPNNKQLFFTQQSIEDNRSKNANKRIPISFESYYTHNDWLNLSKTVDTIYHQLPYKQRQHCLIWTRCYTQAGALNLYGKKHNLPIAFTQHGGYYKWIPNFDKETSIIVVANAEHPADSTGIGSFFKPAFEKLTWRAAVFCPYARQKSNAYYMLYLGEGLKYDSDTLKLRYKDFIFE